MRIQSLFHFTFLLFSLISSKKTKNKSQVTFIFFSLFQGGNALTQELLRRLTRSGTMYLIPADIHDKHIIRFTVTSQFTTAEDILRDWRAISKTASTLLAEAQALNEAEQPKPGKDEVADQSRDHYSAGGCDKREEAVFKRDKAEEELWIDKAWNESRRPMRSLSCSSEPLPCAYTGLNPGLQDAIGVLLVPSEAGPDPETESAAVPSNPAGKQAMKKLTKFYSMPIFCNPWLQCARHQVCCPVPVAQTRQTPLTSTCRRTNSKSSSPVANTAPSPTPLESATEQKLL